MATFETLCGFIALLLALYYLLKPPNFWEKNKIPGPKPIPVFGNAFPTAIGRISLGDHITHYYKQYKHERVFGGYFQTEHLLVINDPDLIKTVLIKDFSKFANRGLRVNEKVNM